MKNYTIIIFGGTGDLSKRKLVPALIALVNEDKNLKITVLGIGHKNYTEDQYKTFLLSETNLPENLSIYYYKADFNDGDSFKELKDKLLAIESIVPEEKLVGRICYLATSYTMFETIAKNIAFLSSKEDNIFTRIVAEKPFGSNLKSSNSINATLRKYFTEEQIYRVDHYLAKETIDTLLKMRLSNPLFENIWNSKFISKIHIFAKEELGVGNRVGYYDNAGAVKDMIQSHMLEITSLVLMDPPKSLEDKDFKNAKVKAIKSLRFKNEISIGQYRGYQEEVKVIHPGSQTETFVELKLYSKARRWKGTEITLKTGKMLDKREAHISLIFKKEPCMIYCNINSSPNKLVFHIQPIQDIELTMNTSMPGKKMSLTPVKMTFAPATEFRANTPEAYEVILRDCMAGDKKIFICDKELEVAWKLTDKITEYLKKLAPIEYEPGSVGPKSN